MSGGEFKMGSVSWAVEKLSKLCDSRDPVIVGMLVQHSSAIISACEKQRQRLATLSPLVDCYLASLPADERSKIVAQFSHLFPLFALLTPKDPPTKTNSNTTITDGRTIIQLRAFKKAVLSTSNPNQHAQSLHKHIDFLLPSCSNT